MKIVPVSEKLRRSPWGFVSKGGLHPQRSISTTVNSDCSTSHLRNVRRRDRTAGIVAIHVQAGNKCLNGQAPTYLADFCRQTGDRRSGITSAETWILYTCRAQDPHTATDHLLSQGQASGTACLLP